MSKRGANGDNTIITDTTKHNYSVVLNGITWTALATKPTSASNPTPIPTFITNESDTKYNNGTINRDTTQVTITGTVATQGQSFKYRYTSADGTSVSNSEQQLPSSVTTIKIVLKKAGSK